MKNVVSKLIPLVFKLKGKKKSVIILSVVAIAAVIFAVEKGYISEDVVKFDVIIDQISAAFPDSAETVNTVDSVVNVVDTIANH
jgi:hypothetical protein